MDHDFGIVLGPSWSFCGWFLGCVAQLGLAFRGVPLLECSQGCGTAGMPAPGLTARFGGGRGRCGGLAGIRSRRA